MLRKGTTEGMTRKNSPIDFKELLRNQAVSMSFILIGLWIILAFLSPYFFTVTNIFEITLQTAVIGIIAVGQTFVIISGGIDLSVGSVFACSCFYTYCAIAQPCEPDATRQAARQSPPFNRPTMASAKPFPIWAMTLAEPMT